MDAKSGERFSERSYPKTSKPLCSINDTVRNERSGYHIARDPVKEFGTLGETSRGAPNEDRGCIRTILDDLATTAPPRISLSMPLS